MSAIQRRRFPTLLISYNTIQYKYILLHCVCYTVLQIPHIADIIQYNTIQYKYLLLHCVCHTASQIPHKADMTKKTGIMERSGAQMSRKTITPIFRIPPSPTMTSRGTCLDIQPTKIELSALERPSVIIPKPTYSGPRVHDMYDWNRKRTMC